MEKRISTEEGTLLCVNRSVQSEDVFAMIKENMYFRRFLTRGNANVTVEWYLVSMAYNLLKLHQKYKQTIPRISVMMSWGFLCHFKTIWDSKGIVLYLNGIKYRIHCQKAQTLDKSCLY